MKQAYFDTVTLVERLHRLFLEVIRVELDRLGIYDINNVQSLVLYNLGKNQLTVSELTTRGYYLGSNVSYNLRKMVQNGYVAQEQSPHDRRSSLVKLTPRGLELHKKIDTVLNAHLSSLDQVGVKMDMIQQSVNVLKKLESFWQSVITPRARI